MKNGNFRIENDHFRIKNLISRNGHRVVGQLSGMSANRLMRNFEVI